jgi:hypothetical protein
MRKLDLRRHAPVIVIVLLVVGPLAIWAATSGGSGDGDKQGLIVERGVSITGEPELVLSIAGDVEVTSGASSVTVECLDKDGKTLIKGTQPWPFIEEPGYPYAHVHQVDSPEKVEGARRCRVLGTNARLEAKVQ